MNEYDDNDGELLEENELLEALVPLTPDPETFEEGVRRRLAAAEAHGAPKLDTARALGAAKPRGGRWMRRAAALVPPGALEASFGLKTLSGAAGKGGLAAGGATFGLAIAGLLGALGLFALGLFGIRRTKAWNRRDSTRPDGRPDFFIENVVIGGLIMAGFFLYYFLRHETPWITLAGGGAFLLVSMAIAIGMVERKGPLPRSAVAEELQGVLTQPFVLFLMMGGSLRVTPLPATVFALGILGMALAGGTLGKRKFASFFPIIGVLLMVFVRSPLGLNHRDQLLGQTPEEFVHWANTVALDDSEAWERRGTWERLGWLSEALEPEHLAQIDKARVARALESAPESLGRRIADEAAFLGLRAFTEDERTQRELRNGKPLPEIEESFALTKTTARIRLAEELGDTSGLADQGPWLEELLRRTWDPDGSILYSPGGFFASAADRDHPYLDAGLAAVFLLAQREREDPGVLGRTGISLGKLQRYFMEEAIGTRSLAEDRTHFEGALAYFWLRQTFHLPLKPRRERVAVVFLHLSALVSVALALLVLLRAPRSIAAGPKGN